MGFSLCCWAKLMRQGGATGGEEENGGGQEELTDLFFDLRALQVATNFFSELNKLGHGGFGPVYKGLVPNGQVVAVKKLSIDSRQGIREFMNEVKLLLRIQHKNLVTLLGCCVQGPEKILVYEYLPNKSLDYLLFDKTTSPSLDWTNRFHIVSGIARGLLYLHEDAPKRIIHRDIKASNILLDEQLNPKISDFGLASLFPEDDSHMNIFKICGTRGYMAPEYARNGYLSVKTDVFSFGVLILEIVSGRKNNDRQLGVQKADLLSYAWVLFQAGNLLKLVDSRLDKYNHDEAAMCIQLGLSCCQASVADRPDMNSVCLMLSSDSFTLPRPGKPGTRGPGELWPATTSTAFTNTNASSTWTAVASASTGSSFVEEFSGNYMSCSSIDEVVMVFPPQVYGETKCSAIMDPRIVIQKPAVQNVAKHTKAVQEYASTIISVCASMTAPRLICLKMTHCSKKFKE